MAAKMELGELIWKISGDTADIKKKLGETEKGTKKLGSGFKKFAGIAATALVAVGIAKFTKEIILAASAAAETRAKFETAFKGINDEADRATKTLTNGYGLSNTAAERLLSNTGDLLKGFGATSTEALNLSFSVQTLAADLSSYNNLPIEQASAAITKAFTGERESLKSLGVIVSEAAVKQQLLLDGTQDLTGKELLLAKGRATLTLITQQSGDAIGDMSRTYGSFANQSKVASARVEDLKTSLGKNLLPVATFGISVFNKFATSILPLVDSLGVLVSSQSSAQRNSGELRLQVERLNTSYAEYEVILGKLNDPLANLNKLEKANLELKLAEKNIEVLDSIEGINEAFANKDDAQRKDFESMRDLKKETQSYQWNLDNLALSSKQAAKQKRALAKSVVDYEKILASGKKSNLEYEIQIDNLAKSFNAGTLSQSIFNSLNIDLRVNIKKTAIELKNQGDLIDKVIESDDKIINKTKEKININNEWSDKLKARHLERLEQTQKQTKSEVDFLELEKLILKEKLNVLDTEKEASINSLKEKFDKLSENNSNTLRLKEAFNQELLDLESVFLEENQALKDESAEKELEKQEETLLEQATMFSDYTSSVVGSFASMSDSIGELLIALTAVESAEIESRKKAELKAAGFATKTALQEAKAELKIAKAQGDQEAIDEANKNVKLAEINEKYAKEQGDLAYRVANIMWGLQLSTAIATGAAAVVAALLDGLSVPGPAGIALGAVASAAAATASGVQIATIALNKPKRENYTEGGIVPGNDFVGDRIQANVNSGELILNKEQQSELYNIAKGDQVNNNETPIEVTAVFNVDGVTLAEIAADVYNRGVVLLNLDRAAL